MDQKLITFAVPCYNSAAYMRHCIETLLSAGERAEIILVDDGSVKDETPAICDEYAAKYPTIIRSGAVWCSTRTASLSSTFFRASVSSQSSLSTTL